MKTIVTHIGPDLDAITSVWLLKTFLPEWHEASIAFVPAGKTFKNDPPDADPEIIHVDTGFGKFDHHQTDADTCAAKLVYEEVVKTHGQDEALLRLVNLVNDIDHFREVFFPNPAADFWDLSLVNQIDGWRLLHPDDPLRWVDWVMNSLDAIYKNFQNKIWAEKEIKENSLEFETPWGKGLGLETTNDEVVHLGQKMGYNVVVRKDPRKGYVRIKSLPKDEIDLTKVYNKLLSLDPEATWFLHASRHMVLNGTSKNPDMRPTKLGLNEIIEVIKNE